MVHSQARGAIKMGTVIRFPRQKSHARASLARSIGEGRGTSRGQTASSGHLSENQSITSSYLRAVNVLASSSKRSKKRQSPAARRPKVDKLTEREVAYAEAHAMRFERSSDSMAMDDSRKIPTVQDVSVGNFRLAEVPEKSDKSAMPTVDQIRLTIQRALDRKGVGAVTVALALEQERNHLRDFLIGKKQSLKTEFAIALADYLDLNFKDLVITKEKKMRRAG